MCDSTSNFRLFIEPYFLEFEAQTSNVILSLDQHWPKSLFNTNSVFTRFCLCGGGDDDDGWKWSSTVIMLQRGLPLFPASARCRLASALSAHITRSHGVVGLWVCSCAHAMCSPRLAPLWRFSFLCVFCMYDDVHVDIYVV